MPSRGQIAGRRLLRLLWRPAPSPRAFCAAEEAQLRPWPAEVRASSEALWRKLQAGGASVTRDFISEEEEALLAQELEPQLRRHRYQDEHWDGAIHKYRETEKSYWSKECHEILQRVRNAAFPPGVPQLAQVHVLDLDKSGHIKPHVDSVKFCGCTIAGLSLLSTSVMHLVSQQNPQDWLDLLLERRSLYILRGPARYEFTHEILKDEESFFDGRKVARERRVSVICRNLPLPAEPS
ncbi:alpha-ketoglutarate-dependent dioxygenase alkB homolog 7, mitochondrial [Pantherophis guttatus]|uniref:Alpha-ketoglutarate-dependent dioxygenase alkB homolog 7, mitochondrial n=1 Tax=Pantherophis guttatus TaxID=94885 RepID=A0A6P9D4E7_PANGU|nr:alpha-ketoglutarate-dependent dioxygenase alkB homolog 7, mitochondrial [Pantherophis guttatus]